MTKVDILGVSIDNLSLQEVLGKAEQFINSKNQYFITTPNPEFLVSAQKDRNFKEILNYSDIAVADGIGLIYAAKFLGERLQRLTGVDLMWHLCEMAEQKSYPVYLLGAGEGVAAAAGQVIKKYFPKIQISGAQSGAAITANGQPDKSAADWATNNRIINEVNITKPKILFVAFGHGKQEKWIFNYLDKMPPVKIAIGVGGAFDYISQKITRAPEYIRRLGLEWLYRLIKEPKRIKRIFNATIIFPALVLKQKIFHKNKKEA